MSLPTYDASAPTGSLFNHWRNDLPASLVVFLVAMPLCLGIALASGAPVSTGLVTGIVGGIVVGALAGSPLQVSGPAAGLTVVCAEMIRQHGMIGLGVIVLLAGCIQIAAGVARLGKWFTAVSPAVIHGMLSGIGVLILAGQLHVLVDRPPQGSGVQNIRALPESLGRGLGIPRWESAADRRLRRDLLQQLNQFQSRQSGVRGAVLRQVEALTQATVATGATLSAPAPDWQPLADQQSQLVADMRSRLDQLAQSLPAEHPIRQSLSGRWADAESVLNAAVASLQAGHVEQLIASQTAAVAEMKALLASQQDHPTAFCLGVLTIVLIVVWNRWARGPCKAIPGALLGIVCAGLLAWGLQLPVLYVNVPDDLMSDLSWVGVSSFRSLPVRDMILGAIVTASIASAETLLCATAVDKMHSGPRTRYDQELVAQGVGNVLCGCVGVLPMTGVIVRSATNVQAGGRTRLSAILHGVWLVVFVILLKDLVRAIPVAALAGILVYTGFRLIDIRGFRKLWSEHRAGAWIFLTTVVVIVVEDLLTGVITGIVLSALKLLLRFSQFEATLTESNGRFDLRLYGAATFLKLPNLSTELARIPRGRDVHAHLEELTLVDHACLELLVDWGKQYEKAGGKFHIDWDQLHTRFNPKLRSVDVISG